MNATFSVYLRLATIAAGLIAIQDVSAAPASPTPPPSGNAVVQSNAIPESVFTIPKSPKDGRDPFFPESLRFADATTSTNAKSVSPDAAALLLKGISGNADHRLAIINGRTLAEGEETDILIGANRIHFRCVEIKEQSAVIEIGGTRRELHLRSDF